ncbi:MAG: hypothetical protein HOC52_00005, partial [Thiotrichales bacterium]|nr:hypothetical protein [Thiotrichales bacterium]
AREIVIEKGINPLTHPINVISLEKINELDLPEQEILVGASPSIQLAYLYAEEETKGWPEYWEMQEVMEHQIETPEQGLVVIMDGLMGEYPDEKTTVALMREEGPWEVGERMYDAIMGHLISQRQRGEGRRKELLSDTTISLQ